MTLGRTRLLHAGQSCGAGDCFDQGHVAVAVKVNDQGHVAVAVKVNDHVNDHVKVNVVKKRRG